MLSAESERGRRIIGRLDKGTDLLVGIAEVCKKHRVRTATLSGLGALERLEVSEYDQRNRVYKPSRAFEGVFEVLNVTGNVSDRDNKPFVHAHVTVSRERDNGIEVLGGHLLAARVFAFEFVLEVMDDLVLKRTADQTTGLHLWSEAISFEPDAEAARQLPAWNEGNTTPAKSSTSTLTSPSTTTTPSTSTSTTPSTSTSTPSKPNDAWARVIAVSSAQPAPAAAEADTRVRPGDLIDHPKFQRCVVERVEGDYEFVQVRLSNRRLVRLSLDVLSFVQTGTEGKARVFKAKLGGQP